MKTKSIIQENIKVESEDKSYDLILEVSNCHYEGFTAYLRETPEPEDRESHEIICGQFRALDYDGSPELFYIGAGYYADPDVKSYSDGRDLTRDRVIYSPDEFGKAVAKVDAKDVVDSWYFPEGVSEEAKDAIRETIQNALENKCVDAANTHAESEQEEEKESAEKLTVDTRCECGVLWLIRPDIDNAATWWWDNGGGELWKELTGGNRYQDEVIVNHAVGERFILDAAKVPGFFSVDGTPFCFFPATDEDQEGSESE